MEIFDSIIIGAGQAGLAMSASLRLRGIRHVVLERGGCRAMAQRAMGADVDFLDDEEREFQAQMEAAGLRPRRAAEGTANG